MADPFFPQTLGHLVKLNSDYVPVTLQTHGRVELCIQGANSFSSSFLPLADMQIETQASSGRFHKLISLL